MKTFTDFVTIFTASALVGFGVIYLAGQSGCTHQLTVEEADSALAASCVILAQAMTEEGLRSQVSGLSSDPDPAKSQEPRAKSLLLDRVVAQACKPGRTRGLIARILASHPVVEGPTPGTPVQGTNSSTTEYLDFLLDGSSGKAQPPAPATNLPPDDAGVHP